MYVQDTGKGIDEKELMMIFDRFIRLTSLNKGADLDFLSVKSLLRSFADV